MIPRKLLEIAKSTDDRALAAGAIGGLSGQLVFAAARIVGHLLGPAGGSAAAVRGVEWGPHLLSSLAVGVGFAVLVSNTSLEPDTLVRSVAYGVGYGLLVWAVSIPTILEIGFEAFGVSSVPPVEALDPGGFGRPVVYGVVVGIVYPLYRDGEMPAVLEE